MEQNIEIARNAANEFHRRLEAKQEGQIVAEADPLFMVSNSRDSTIAMLTRVRRKLGAVRASEPAGVQVNVMPQGTFIVAQFRTRFEKGEAQEKFTWIIHEGKSQLAGYFVDSPLLMTN
jgi:uncharacterized protein DUF4019